MIDDFEEYTDDQWMLDEIWRQRERAIVKYSGRTPLPLVGVQQMLRETFTLRAGQYGIQVLLHAPKYAKVVELDSMLFLETRSPVRLLEHSDTLLRALFDYLVCRGKSFSDLCIVIDRFTLHDRGHDPANGQLCYFMFAARTWYNVMPK